MTREPMIRYTIEFDGGQGRSFVMTGFPLTAGGRYEGPILFPDERKALAVMEEDRDSQESDDSVSKVLIHPDGRIEDASGVSLTAVIARQAGLPEADLQASLASYYSEGQATAAASTQP